MNVAEWILVIFLSVALLVFLILGIVLLAKLIGITKEAKKIIIKGQDIAENANGVVENVKDMTSIGVVVKSFADKFGPNENKGKEKSDGQREEKGR